MDLKVTIPQFLKAKLLKKNLSLKELARLSNIHYITMHNIYHGNKSKPDLNTTLKIADFFRCSVDEVIGRDCKNLDSNYKIYTFKTLDKISINNNIKYFILKKIKEKNTTLNNLSLEMGFNRGFLTDFIKEKRAMKSLSTLSVYIIAEYFDISIDVMIGRVV